MENVQTYQPLIKLNPQQCLGQVNVTTLSAVYFYNFYQVLDVNKQKKLMVITNDQTWTTKQPRLLEHFQSTTIQATVVPDIAPMDAATATGTWHFDLSAKQNAQIIPESDIVIAVATDNNNEQVIFVEGSYQNRQMSGHGRLVANKLTNSYKVQPIDGNLATVDPNGQHEILKRVSSLAGLITDLPVRMPFELVRIFTSDVVPYY